MMMCCQLSEKAPGVWLGGSATLGPCKQLSLAEQQRSPGLDPAGRNLEWRGELWYGWWTAGLWQNRAVSLQVSLLLLLRLVVTAVSMYVLHRNSYKQRWQTHTSTALLHHRAPQLQEDEADTEKWAPIRIELINFVKLGGVDSVALSGCEIRNGRAMRYEVKMLYKWRVTICTRTLSKTERVTKDL